MNDNKQNTIANDPWAPQYTDTETINHAKNAGTLPESLPSTPKPGEIGFDPWAPLE
ncbi:hypothetical protein [Bifidobacterium sp. UTBIF-68]|uniref:hypothetical protein n=1 Tax=Bifidobacterium sp. UTBIF-68 TaxID=1465262 RepID=UPI0015E2F60F|nr:hypothetical protein [Bifidobacterium sp. UTBIF-68]